MDNRSTQNNRYRSRARGRSAGSLPAKRVKGARKIRKNEVAPFTQKLAAMLDAGLPLVQCLNALSEQTEDPNFRLVLEDITSRVEGGAAFAEALKSYPNIFGNLYINMIRAGELSGSLSEVAARLASYLEASSAMVRKVKSALTYPAVVVTLAILLSIAMLVFIVPVFDDIFEGFDAELPIPTQILINISNTMRDNALYVILIIIGIVLLLRYLKKTPQGAMAFDSFLLKAPIAGNLIEKIALARMSRTFASLLRSGVPILQTIEIVSQATGNRIIGSALAGCGSDIEGGSNIGYSLKKTGRFPPMVIHMVSAGEKTGNIDGMLEKVADFYEDEVSNTLDSLASMIEPLLMAFIGVVIGAIVVCMFLPIFKMHEIVQ